MISDPCSKLMMLRTPQTSENPTPMQLYKPPSTSPFTSTWMYSNTSPAPAPGRPIQLVCLPRTASLCRDRLQVGLLDLIGVDHHDLLVLNLVDGWRVGIGLAIGPEPDRCKKYLELAVCKDV